jgi:pyruvate ferredoxin oxidoreductase delta subunit
LSKPKIVKFKYPKGFAEMPLGPSADSGILTEPNAGWRVMRPILSNDKCVKCLKCWILCPEGTIDKEEGDLTIDYNYCKGCGICAEECPTKAITMVREGE